MFKRIIITSLSTFFIALAANTAQANSFETAAQHLDLDGALVGYIDFEGDGEAIASRLNTLYASALESIPTAPPAPIDFDLLFENLGFGSVRGMGLSSKKVADGLFRNRYITLLDGEPEKPKGLFDIYSDGEPQMFPFTAAALAPADATTVGTWQFNLYALRDTAKAVMGQIMGPMGESLIDSQTEAPIIPGTDVSINDLIQALSGKIDFAVKQSFGADLAQTIKIWAQIDEAAPLLDRMAGMAELLSVKFTHDATGTTADFSELINREGFQLFLHAPAGSDHLLVFSDPKWTVATIGSSIADTDEYKRLARHLPAQAHAFQYDSGFDFEPMLGLFAASTQTASYADLARQGFDFFLGGFLKPNASYMIFSSEAIVQEQYASYSTKQIIVTVPAALAVGLTSAMAIPAFQKVRANAIEKTITNNLRQISAAAQQHFMETGQTSVQVKELIGPEAYIHSLDSVAGENYEDLVIRVDMKVIQVNLPDGKTVEIPFN